MRKYVNLVVVSIVLVIIDQITKYWALANIYPGREIPVTPFFNLTLVYNTGGAFGFLSQSSPGLRTAVFVAAVCIILVVLVAFYIQNYAKSRWGSLWLILVIGGAIGNLVDRVRLGKVVDFLDLHLAGRHWPAFNFADICVTLGIVLFIIFIIFDGVARKPK